MRSTSPISTSSPWLGLAAAFALLAADAGALARPPERDIAELQRRAEAGDAEAQNELGGHLTLLNESSRLAEAREWFRRASAAGHAEGMNNYANAVELGAGGPADEVEARRLREAAAARGSVGANMSIAERYERGVGGYPRDPIRALAHMRTAAESGRDQAEFAQWRLAMMYLQGVGGTPDAAEAYRWVVRASEGGSESAMISRAVMLATGEGVAEDDAAARSWYQRVAESGDVSFAHGLRGLGGMLISGEGGPADLPRGVAYLRIAQAGNDANAAQLLEHYRDRITAEVDREAWIIVRQWMREHMPDAEPDDPQ